jgi:tetratricopeptide (TPR) repeat protein
VLETLSVSHGKALSYFPVIDLLTNYFRIASDDDQRIRREKVAGRIAILDRTLEDTLPYVFGLLGITEQPDPLTNMDSKIRKRRTLDAIKRILLRESLNQSLMVIFEDLHCIDDESQALLNLLADSIGTSKILMLVNYRPEYGSKSYYTQLRLGPLGKTNADEMLSDLLGSGKDLEPLKRLIIEKTEGNPFFMEETVQVLLDEGVLVRNGSARLTKPLRNLKIPPTVRAILAARIDRLPSAEKGLLQTLAVIGREFAVRIVREVSGADDVEAMLDRLQLAEFIYEQPAAGDLEYVFKHALTQEVALDSLLNERRKLLHARAGLAIEKLFGERLNDHLGQLARHYSRSSNREKALHYLERAGQQAAHRSAFTEALEHYGAALELLKAMPVTPEGDRQELKLLVATGLPLAATKGYGAKEPESAYLRAIDLSNRLNDTDALFNAEYGLSSVYAIRGQIRSGLQVAKHLLELAANRPEQIFQAKEYIGRYSFWLGELAACNAHMEEAIQLSAAHHEGDSTLSIYAILPECWTYLAWALWYQGYPDQAVEKIQRALAMCRETPHAWYLTGVLSHAARLYILRREPKIVDELALASSELAIERGDASFIGESAMIRGWAMVHSGDEAKGIEVFEEGLAAELAIMDTGWYFGGWPAEVYLKIGRIEHGLSWVADLLKPGHEEHVFEADLHRLKGELILMQDVSLETEAEQCFQVAIEIARRQGSKSLELRAKTSLARLLAKQGNRDEARSVLSEIYNWFTEGFDTADLKDAKKLIIELTD